MKRCFLILISVALPVASARAQLPPAFYQPLSQIKEFLQLTDSQLQTILTNNDAYNQWSAGKQNRIQQVQTEIAAETGKSPLDPNALGIRYAEIETICREIKDKANEYRSRNIDVLNQDQKPKLKLLEDALKLAPVISEGQYGNLIGGLSSAPYGFTGNSIGYGGSLFGAAFSPANGCYLPFPISIPTAAFRTGDFRSVPNLIPANRVSGATLMVNRPTRWFNTTGAEKH
jgi:hypothetical protein